MTFFRWSMYCWLPFTCMYTWMCYYQIAHSQNEPTFSLTLACIIYDILTGFCNIKMPYYQYLNEWIGMICGLLDWEVQLRWLGVDHRSTFAPSFEPLLTLGVVNVEMMLQWNGNTFCIIGPLSGEFTGHRWIPFTKGQWCGWCQIRNWNILDVLIYCWQVCTTRNLNAGHMWIPRWTDPVIFRAF